MKQQCYLGIDLGAESGRVVAGLWNGEAMQLEELHRFPNGGVWLGETLRWDVLRLWTEVEAGLAVAARRFGNSVRSIGVDTWGVDFTLLSRSGELLGWPCTYRDARTRGIMPRVFGKVSRAEVFRATGVQFMEINTLYQIVALAERSPEILAAADRFLMIPDFFNWCLCGEQAGEFTNATTTQFFGATQRTWCTDLLARLGLRADILPNVVQPGTRLGVLRSAVANRAGLGAVQVIAPATHDTGSAVAAVPSAGSRPDWAYISSGTWSLMGVEVREPILTDRALELNFTNEGGLDGTYRLLKNIMGLWIVQQCRKSFAARQVQLGYDDLAALAQQAQPFASFIDPDDASFLNPPDMPAAIQEFCRATRQPVPQTEGALIRCALESLALKYGVVLQSLEQLTGERIKVVHVVGGGSRNALLNQFTANACNRPVVAGPVEATVLGNLLVQARAVGELATPGDIRRSVAGAAPLREFTPELAHENAWAEARGRFQQLLFATGNSGAG